MVPLEKAAQKLKLSLEDLQDRLRERGITIVGRGRRARIAAADVERVSRPIKILQPSPEAEEFLRRRGEALWALYRPSTGNKVVVPFIRRPRK